MSLSLHISISLLLCKEWTNHTLNLIYNRSYNPKLDWACTCLSLPVRQCLPDMVYIHYFTYDITISSSIWIWLVPTTRIHSQDRSISKGRINSVSYSFLFHFMYGPAVMTVRYLMKNRSRVQEWWSTYSLLVQTMKQSSIVTHTVTV